MTVGEKLLELSIEYQNVKLANDLHPEHADKGRTLAAIGADYESALRELLS